MEAKNFRIGNLIDTINRGNSVHLPVNHPVKIFEISAFEVIVHDPEKHPATLKTMPVFGLQDVCGIKIDEFWLKALGFVWSSMRKGWHISKGGVEILFDKDFGCYIEMVGINIDYVHELQNLFFAIHKEELQLKAEPSTCG